MQYTSNTPMTTETKVALGILGVTVLIIIGGLAIFKNSTPSGGGLTEDAILRNIDSGLAFSADLVAPAANPKITGSATTTSSSTEPIFVTEYMDYECPACAVQGEAISKQLLDTYGNRITITRRILPIHGQPSIEAARMVLAAQETSMEAYQSLHTKVFETQTTWARMGTKDREAFFRKLTADLKLDYDKLVADGKTAKYADQIRKDQADAITLGIKATPSFIINNTTRVTGGVPFEYFERYIDGE